MNTISIIAALITSGVIFTVVRNRNRKNRMRNAVGRKTVLVMPNVDEQGGIDMRFIPGVFEEIEMTYLFKISDSEKYFNIPTPILLRLNRNPGEQMFDGAEYILRVSEQEVSQFEVLEKNPPEPELHVH